MGSCCDKDHRQSTTDAHYLADDIEEKKLVMQSCPPRLENNSKSSQPSTIEDSQINANPEDSGLNSSQELYPQFEREEELKLQEQGQKLLIRPH